MYWNRVYRVSRDLTLLMRGRNQFFVATPLDGTRTAEMDAPSLEVLSYFMEPCTPQAAFGNFGEKLGISESQFANALDVMVENELLELANTEAIAPESDIFSLDERPDLIEQAKQTAPVVVRRLFDKVSLQLADGSLARDKSVFDLFPEFQSVQWEATRIVAHMTSIPITWERPFEDLPDGGFDWAAERGIQEFVDGKSPTMLVGLNIDLTADQLGTGQSYRMVEQMRRVALRHGLRGVIIPIRPTMKSAYPLVPMERYIGWKGEDGLPLDPWLETHYGYKNHFNADQEHKLIQEYEVTHAAVHDSRVFEDLLDQTVDDNGDKRPVYADSAYRSKEHEETLADAQIESQVCEKGTRGCPLSEEQKQSNRRKSKVRARVEHIFGAQQAMGGHLVRTIGLARAKVKIGLMNLVYNMRRLVQLLERDAKAFARTLSASHG